MRTILRPFSATLLALGLAACGGGEEAQPTPAPTPEATPAPTPEPTPEATPAAAGQLSETLKSYLGTISEADKARTNPKAGDAKALADGKAQFDSLCMPCHGTSGKGDGPAAAALKPAPADLTDGAISAQITSGQRFAILKNGIPNTAMQAFGAALSDDIVWSLVAYTESLIAAAPAGDPAAAAPAAPAAPATH